MKKHLVFVIMLLSILCAGVVSALSLDVEDIKVDDVSATNRLSLDRGETYDIEIIFTPTEDIKDMEIEAFISGYEYSYDERISDIVPADDYDKGVTYKEELTITIPNDVEEDDYKLRIIFSDRNNETLIKNFNLKLDPVRDAMEIADVILSQDSIEAGSVLTAVVRVANFGSYDEKDVRVELTIPELGLRQVSYIDEIDYEDEESSDELYLRIPSEAKSGIYNLDVKVEFDRKHQSVEDSVEIRVTNKEESTPKTKTVILIGSNMESASKDKPGVYPITITNYAKYNKTFTLVIDGVEGWADAEINPASAIILGPNETTQVAVVLTPNKGVEGSRVFTLTVSDNKQASKQVPLTVNVMKTSSDLTPYLVCLLAALIFVVFAGWGLRKINNKSHNPSNSKNVDTYY